MTAAGRHAEEPWSLRLYVAGQTPRSLAAFVNVKAICERHLAGRVRLEVVDLLQEPGRARRDGILAVPALVRSAPEPGRRLVGHLSDCERVLAGLDVVTRR
jgi:circadian clock protein KaiB